MAQQICSSKIRLADLNSLLTCVLCNGYFIDATTISECLHSFCKTCIVRYLQTNKYCPICEVQVHKTRPLLSIRSDQTLQDIVYKVVPGLFKNEMKKRREFYAKQNASGNGVAVPVSGEKRGDVLGCERLIFTPEDVISISLEYCPPDFTFPLKVQMESSYPLVAHRRYLQCPGGLTVCHLKKFLRAKYGLLPQHNIDIMYMHDHLLDEYTLVDLAYSYSWRRNGPMRLFYKIHEEVKSEKQQKNKVPQVSVMSLSSCPDLPSSSSSPSVAAAPFSQLHLQCQPSPPPSPQAAVEPGYIKVDNPNCAAMSNDHSFIIEVERSETAESATKLCSGRCSPFQESTSSITETSPVYCETQSSFSCKRKTPDSSNRFISCNKLLVPKSVTRYCISNNCGQLCSGNGVNKFVCMQGKSRYCSAKHLCSELLQNCCYSSECYSKEVIQKGRHCTDILASIPSGVLKQSSLFSSNPL